MIRYNRDETYRLADFYQETLPPTTPEIDAIGKVSLHETLDSIYQDNDDTTEALMDFIGTYNYVVTDAESYQMLYHFLFVMPFQEILLYAGNKTWRGIVAKWRIELEK